MNNDMRVRGPEGNQPIQPLNGGDTDAKKEYSPISVEFYKMLKELTESVAIPFVLMFKGTDEKNPSIISQDFARKDIVGRIDVILDVTMSAISFPLSGLIEVTGFLAYASIQIVRASAMYIYDKLTKETPPEENNPITQQNQHIELESVTPSAPQGDLNVVVEPITRKTPKPLPPIPQQPLPPQNPELKIDSEVRQEEDEEIESEPTEELINPNTHSIDSSDEENEILEKEILDSEIEKKQDSTPPKKPNE